MQGVSQREVDRWQRRFEYYNRKFLIGRSGKTLLIKNPVYTGRVALIRKTWPGARFIHIYRNPYEVFASSRKFYRALLPRLALQAFEDELADGLIAETYPKMVDNLYKDVRDLDRDRFVELRFEDLEHEPLAQLERVYTSLAIPGFAGLRDDLRKYLGSIADYKKNKHVFTDELVEAVDRHWGGLVERWGYQPPH